MLTDWIIKLKHDLIFISTSTCTHFCKINFPVDFNKKKYVHVQGYDKCKKKQV